MLDNRFAEVRFLLKHSSIYGVGSLLSKGVGFLLLPLYTRYLDPKDYGILELIEAFTGMVGIVAGIGIGTAMSRYYFEKEDPGWRKTVISTTYVLVFMTTVVCVTPLGLASGWLSTLVFGTTDYLPYFVIALAGLGLGVILDVGLMYLRILQKSDLFVGISLVSLLVSVALNIYFIVFLGTGPIGMLYSVLFTRLLIGLPVTALILARTGVVFKKHLAIDMLKYSAPLVPAEVAHVAVSYSDRFFVNYYVSTAAAGIYGIAQKLGTILHVLVTSPFITTFLPRRFEIAKKGDAQKTLSTVFDAYVAIMLVLTTVLAVFAKEVITVLTAPEFHPAAKYIPLIALIVLVQGMKYHVQFGIFFQGKTAFAMYISLVTMAFHLLANFILVPQFGIWGAVLAAGLATTLNTTLYYLAGQRFYHIPYKWTRIAIALGGAVLVFLIATVPFRDALLSLLWKIGVFSCALLALFWSGAINIARLKDTLFHRPNAL